jgi:hypothetical protein
MQAADMLIDEATMAIVGAALAEIIVQARSPANSESRLPPGGHSAAPGPGIVRQWPRSRGMSIDESAGDLDVQPIRVLHHRSGRAPITPNQSLKDDLVQAHESRNSVSMQRLLGKSDSAGASSSLSRAFHQQRVSNVRIPILHGESGLTDI